MSLLTKRVGVDQQGQLQGAMQILFGLTGLVIGPITFTNLFAWAIGPAQGSPAGPADPGRRRSRLAGFLWPLSYARPVLTATCQPLSSLSRPLGRSGRAIIAPESSAE